MFVAMWTMDPPPPPKKKHLSPSLPLPSTSPPLHCLLSISSADLKKQQPPHRQAIKALVGNHWQVASYEELCQCLWHQMYNKAEASAQTHTHTHTERERERERERGPCTHTLVHILSMQIVQLSDIFTIFIRLYLFFSRTFHTHKSSHLLSAQI